MKVIDVGKTKGVAFTGGVSYRPVTESDNLGFSVCKTVVPKGGPHKWHYKNHVEACYCVEGKAVIRDIKNKKLHHIAKDIIYYVTHDEHEFLALENTVLISIFNPPLRGDESHDENGNYI